MKKIILSSIFMSAFILLGSFYQASALANPASVKCNLDGGISVTQKDANGGEYSNCKFPDGSVCEEWAYYRGECSPKKPLTLDQLSTSCTSAFDGCNTCSRVSGGQWACTMMACMGEQKSATCKNAASDTGSQNPTMCTMEYAPVCGEKVVGGNVIGTRFIKESKTYSNKCMMQADGASLIHQGSCDQDEGGNGHAPKIPSFCSDDNFKKLTKGSRGEHVVYVQQKLVFTGYLKGKLDGVFGDKTLKAIKDFQKKNKLKQDGVVGKDMRTALCGIWD